MPEPEWTMEAAYAYQEGFRAGVEAAARICQPTIGQEYDIITLSELNNRETRIRSLLPRPPQEPA